MATVPHTKATSPKGSQALPTVARFAGGALLIATASIHLDLYLTGYRQIPTIGWMFLLQVIVASALGLAVVAIGGSNGIGRLVAAAGAGFAVATLGGYLFSMWVGLFGFKEIRTTAGIVAATIEIAAFLALGTLIGWRLPAPGRWIALPATVVAVAVLAVSEVTATGAVAPLPQSSRTTVVGGSSKGSLLIIIKNFGFKPAHASVKPGERITVKNEDSVTHTFTATGSATGRFDSGPIVPGQSRTVLAPAKAGTYPYFCTIHQFMTGVLVVSASASS